MSGQYYNIVIASVLLILFGCYTWYCVKKRSEKITDSLRSGKTFNIHVVKITTGIFLFGFTPFLLTGYHYNYLQPPLITNKIAGVFFLLSSCTVLLSLYAAKQQPPIPVHYSVINTAMQLYLPVRMLFLISYEIFFRGFLLFAVAELWGTAMAAFINISVYALMHAGSGKKEFIGAIPFGLALCIITIESGSVWPAVALHLLLALPFEIAVIRKSLLKPEKVN